MARSILAAVGALTATAVASFASAKPPPDPADLPFYMVEAMCDHHDGQTCDGLKYPPPDYNPLVGTWQRVSILRDGFSLQPPEAPLNIKFMEDGHFAELELPADRLKVDKPIEKQTTKELKARFERVAGSWGEYSQVGQFNWRRHEVRLVPSPAGIQERIWFFEGNALVLEGSGINHSPFVTFMKLPNQPLTSKALVGSWRRTAYEVNGAPVETKAPEIMQLGSDGWYMRTLFPPGRKGLPSANPLRLGDALDDYTVANYVEAYSGVSGTRGVYNASDDTLVMRDIADVDPNLEGKMTRGAYTLDGDTLTWKGTDWRGQPFQATYTRLPPYDIHTPPENRTLPNEPPLAAAKP